MNSVVLTGRLTKDPEVSYTQGQMAICRFTLAVDRPRRKDSEQSADFIRVTVWDKLAENCGRYLSKGRQVAVNGRIQTGSYKDRNGQAVYTTDVVANHVEFLGSKGDNQRSEAVSEPRQDNPQPEQNMSSEAQWELPEGFSEADDDLPF